MTPTQIKQELYDRGYTYRRIAKEYGHNERYISTVIRCLAGAPREL